MPERAQTFHTNPSIFLRIKQKDQAPREIAWQEFQDRYAPIIAGFARKFGARRQDAEDVVQDVMLGFFAKSPAFTYDPSRGRFRGYLKVCTIRALQRRMGQNAKFAGASVSLENIDKQGNDQIEQTWNQAWEEQIFRRALEEVRKEIGQTKNYQAFQQYVLRARPAEEVAAELDMHLNAVYRAKQRVSEILREKVAAMRDEE
jgi:RNA polymerase sigma-70 factor (ECF subfamily)